MRVLTLAGGLIIGASIGIILGFAFGYKLGFSQDQRWKELELCHLHESRYFIQDDVIREQVCSEL
ncbi:MAG: hypothetical protein ACPGRD_12385 [Planktomarina sp.]